MYGSSTRHTKFCRFRTAYDELHSSLIIFDPSGHRKLVGIMLVTTTCSHRYLCLTLGVIGGWLVLCWVRRLAVIANHIRPFGSLEAGSCYAGYDELQSSLFILDPSGHWRLVRATLVMRNYSHRYLQWNLRVAGWDIDYGNYHISTA